MKISDILFEGPYHINGDVPYVTTKEYPSMEGLKRENIFLGTLNRQGEEFLFWLSNSHGVAKVTTSSKDDIGQERQRTLVNLEFQNPVDIPVKNQLHVHKVYTDVDFRNRWLAGALYILLVRYGYSIVSDYTQYNGGKALWKKLATESDARKYVVRVWDDASDGWINGPDGNPLLYNAANLSDDQVWKDISHTNEATTLLVLSNS